MYFVKILTFTTPSTPPDKGIRVVEDDSGWFYLMETLKQEDLRQKDDEQKEEGDEGE